MNKYQKAEYWIKEIDEHPDWGHTEIDWEAIDQLKELINKQEISRWHDLRKDPTDLPKVGEKVLCVTDCRGGREVQIYTKSRINNRLESIWKWKNNTSKSPLAWKYIEEFEDE